MLQTEFLRSVHANYERILLEEKPEERRYQYCILNRGGIKRLLPCSLRYLNGEAYLYYDITSKQSVAQLYERRQLDRQWMKDFLWSLQQVQLELSRFLLDVRNVLWYPQHIFQEVESHSFSFTYVPYYQEDREEDSFHALLEYWIERINYEDELLVETVFQMYDHYEKIGYDYLKAQIFEEMSLLDLGAEEFSHETVQKEEKKGQAAPDEITEEVQEPQKIEALQEEVERQEKKGLRFLFESRKRKRQSDKAEYQNQLQLSMYTDVAAHDKVAEDEQYAQTYGQTIYIPEQKAQQEKQYQLYTKDGQVLAHLHNEVCTIGKKQDEVDVVLTDLSVSRVHARILKDHESFYLEDLNSTNGTSKNGLRMQPYEKRKLESGDEIQFGQMMVIFR